jgi:hypothetical protein
MYALDVMTILLRSHTNLARLDDESALELIIARMLETITPTNYEASVMFDFVNLVTERKTITPFAGHMVALSNLLKGVLQNNSA